VTDREINKFVADFRNAAIEKGDFAVEKRDAELYDAMSYAFHRLKKLGVAGNKALEELLRTNQCTCECG
jgi:DNA-binding GntR family transcriptional regulator